MGLAVTSPSQPAVVVAPAASRAAHLSEVLDAVQSHAYYANRINFPAWRDKLAKRAATGPITPYDDLQLVGQLFVELGDRHSFRLSAGEWARLNDTFKSDTLASKPPDGDVAPGGIGYLELPSVTAAAGSGAYATYVDAAHLVLTSPACGWILDLRGNSGGSVAPMLAAVSPLLGSGIFVGYRGSTATSPAIEPPAQTSVRSTTPRWPGRTHRHATPTTT